MATLIIKNYILLVYSFKRSGTLNCTLANVIIKIKVKAFSADNILFKSFY